MKKVKGAATLLTTVMLFAGVILILVYMSRFSIQETKTSANQFLNAQSFEAAEAGLQYAITYAATGTNRNTIRSSAAGGQINYPLATQTLPNGATFTAVYTNPTANNYDTLLVTSTGTSSDGSTTHVVKQLLVAMISNLNSTFMSQTDVNLSGNGVITGNPSVDAGGALNQNGTNWVMNGANTNDTALASMTSDDIFNFIFGVNTATMKAQSTVYVNDSSVPWATLSGTVWVDSNTRISGNNNIGTPTNPVLLIVNGNFTITGTTNFYGVVITINGGTSTASGTFNLVGGLVSTGTINLNGTSGSYNTMIVHRITGNGNYAPLAGSWRDF